MQFECDGRRHGQLRQSNPESKSGFGDAARTPFLDRVSEFPSSSAQVGRTHNEIPQSTLGHRPTAHYISSSTNVELPLLSLDGCHGEGCAPQQYALLIRLKNRAMATLNLDCVAATHVPFPPSCKEE